MLRHARWAAISALLLVLTGGVPYWAPVPLFGQGATRSATRSGPPPVPPVLIPRWPDNRVVTDMGIYPPEGIEEACFLPPLVVVRRAYSGTLRPEASHEAKRRYLLACEALQQRKWKDAEKHLREAIDQQPRYAAAWVTLGQLMQASQKPAEARKACVPASAADPDYLPAQLCLADIAAHLYNWEQVLKLSQRALEINSSTDPHSYFYAASAYFNLNQSSEAEKNALRAVEIDNQNVEPRTHFLLAQIYEIRGDSTQELVQLREYLKFASPQDAAMVKKYVIDLESKTAQ